MEDLSSVTYLAAYAFFHDPRTSNTREHETAGEAHLLLSQ